MLSRRETVIVKGNGVDEMDSTVAEGRDLDEAIADASHHVEQRGAAAQEALQKQRPKDQGPLLVALTLLLLMSIGWVGVRLQAAPSELPINETANLAWFVVDAVEAVEDFRADQGRLPDQNEASDMLDEGLVFTASGNAYTVSVDDGIRTLEYGSDTPIEEWVNIFGGTSTEGEG